MEYLNRRTVDAAFSSCESSTTRLVFEETNYFPRIFHEMIGLGEAATTTRYSSEFIKMVKQYETTTPYTPLQSTLTRNLGLERWGSHPLEGFRSIEQYHDVDDMMPPLFFCI